MAHDVFISYASADKLIADAAVAHLERKGIRCWYAPRDILPGTSWPAAIAQAITDCRALVIIFSAHSNKSVQVPREVGQACSHGHPVVPVRIERLHPSGDLEYYLSTSHWMDALSPPIEQYLDDLAGKLQSLLNLELKPVAAPAPAAKASGSLLSWSTPTAIGAGAVVVVVVGLTLLGVHLLSKAQPTPAPTPTPTPPIVVTGGNLGTGHDTTPAPTPAPGPAPAPSPAPVNKENVGSTATLDLAQDEATWRRLSTVHWENSFFFDNGKARYDAWKKAADQGDAIAQFFVGCCYRQGAGVAEDQGAATQWLLKSANQGNTDAMTTLAIRYGWGLSIPQDLAQWTRWATQAADRGSAAGMAMLGMGMSAPTNPSTIREQGHMWLKRAADAGSIDSDAWLIGQSEVKPEVMAALLQKDADAGEPGALICIATVRSTDPAAPAMIERALKMMGHAYEVGYMIDPPAYFPLHQTPLVVQFAWRRLQEMADAGSAEAQQEMFDLQRKGFTR